MRQKIVFYSRPTCHCDETQYCSAYDQFGTRHIWYVRF